MRVAAALDVTNDSLMKELERLFLEHSRFVYRTAYRVLRCYERALTCSSTHHFHPQVT